MSDEKENRTHAPPATPPEGQGSLPAPSATPQAGPDSAAGSTPTSAPSQQEMAVRSALETVMDPEIGLSVIDLDLIREVTFTPEEAEVKMVLTTPFCPYGPMLINQIQSVSEQASEMPVKVTVLPDRWEPPPWLR